MSGPLLIPAPGFWGKLPAAADFVGRRLPAAFVEPWDRWLSRHLVSRLIDPDLLCFRLGVAPMTGVVLASADRAGRRFPLTLAAPLDRLAPSSWYAALAALGRAAAAGALDATALDARLLALPAPAPAPAADVPAAALILWTPGNPPRATDPEAPEPVLDALLGATAEAR